MTVFWVVAAGLVVLALWLVAGQLLRPPVPAGPAPNARQVNLQVLRAQLVQNDQDLASATIDAAQHAQTRADIERRVLEEERVAASPGSAGSRRGTLALLLLAVPVLAVALYGVLGNLQALSPEARLAAKGVPAQQDVEVLIARLAERMEKQPPGRVEDAEGWAMLGRTYAALQRYPQAGRAFARALQLKPKDAQLWADQADVLAMQQGQSMRGEPLKMVEQALQFDPKNLKALALAGSAAFERKDFARAVDYWGKASVLAPPDSDVARGLKSSLDEASALAGAGPPAEVLAKAPAAASGALGGGSGSAAPSHIAGSSAPNSTTPTSATPNSTTPDSTTPDSSPTAAGPGLSGRVSLSPALAARMSPDDTLFIFARAADGPRMPLAILKRQARELPLEFRLDDSQAMSPQMKLSGFASVVVGARISKSGNATPQSGDLQGQAGPLPNSSAKVELLIDSVRP